MTSGFPVHVDIISALQVCRSES